MKSQEILSHTAGFFAQRKKKTITKKSNSSGKSSFVNRLKESMDAEESASFSLAAASSYSEQELEDMLDTLYEAGENLKKEPSLSRINEYRESIRHFLTAALPGCYEVIQQKGIKRKIDGEFKQKDYRLVQVIDQKLEKLVAYVLTQQSSQLEIIRKVDDIHGCLIDLFS